MLARARNRSTYPLPADWHPDEADEGKGREKETNFSENVVALLGSKAAVKLDKTRWDVVRSLRNSTSHPSRQVILDPGQAQGVFETAVELLNNQFS